jgi:uncharacterized protein YqeY
MSCDETDAAEAMRQRLQLDLRSAVKARAVRDVAVLRQLIAAIDNAGAVPLTSKAQPTQSEVERRSLGFDDIQALLQHEFDLRRDAANEFSRVGRTVEAETAKFEMEVVGRYLAMCAASEAERTGSGG